MVQLNSFYTKQLLRLNSFTPTKQRAAIGVFGLFSQTAIDAKNKDVDEETRIYSAVRTAVKIVITTIGGITAREIGQKTGEWLIKNDIVEIPQKYMKEWGATSQNVLRQELSNLTDKPLAKIPKKVNLTEFAKTKYGMAFGAVCAIATAAISVFAWDMPFTNKIMNFVIDKFKKNEKQEPSKTRLK